MGSEAKVRQIFTLVESSDMEVFIKLLHQYVAERWWFVGGVAIAPETKMLPQRYVVLMTREVREGE